jgi:hypothetical protein
MASTIMKEFTLYLLSDAVQMCLQDYGYTALPLKVCACARADLPTAQAASLCAWLAAALPLAALRRSCH